MLFLLKFINISLMAAFLCVSAQALPQRTLFLVNLTFDETLIQQMQGAAWVHGQRYVTFPDAELIHQLVANEKLIDDDQYHSNLETLILQNHNLICNYYLHTDCPVGNVAGADVRRNDREPFIGNLFKTELIKSFTKIKTEGDSIETLILSAESISVYQGLANSLGNVPISYDELVTALDSRLSLKQLISLAQIENHFAARRAVTHFEDYQHTEMSDGSYNKNRYLTQDFPNLDLMISLAYQDPNFLFFIEDALNFDGNFKTSPQAWRKQIEKMLHHSGIGTDVDFDQFGLNPEFNLWTDKSMHSRFTSVALSVFVNDHGQEKFFYPKYDYGQCMQKCEYVFSEN